MNEQQFAVTRNPRLRILIPAIVGLAFLMEQLDSTIITTAIPDMARNLATTPVRMNLAVTAYALALAVFIPLSGWFADRFGARRIFTLALAIFTAASALCGIADNFPMLVAMRVLQGFGGAMMTPVGRLVLLRSFPRQELVRAMTYMTLPAILGPIIGPLLGGWLATYASWRWIFYVNVPIGMICMLLALRYLEDSVSDATIRFDVAGFLMFGGGIALLQIGIDTMGRSQVPKLASVGLFAVAAVLMVAFVFYARSVALPVVRLGLFRQRSFAIGSLAGGLCRIAMNGAPFLLPLMLQVGFGMSPIGSGSLTFLGSVGGLMARGYISPLLRALGFDRVLIVSALASTAVLASFALIGPDTPHWMIGCDIVIYGLIRSTHYMTSNTLSYADVPAARLSQATSLGGLVQQLTVSLGVSFSAVLLAMVSMHGRTLTPAHFHLVFLLMSVLPLLALPGFMRLRREDGALVSGHRRQ